MDEESRLNILKLTGFHVIIVMLQPSVRKTHCGGRKHKENVCVYYQKWLEEQVQKLVDDTSKCLHLHFLCRVIF